MRRFSRIVFAQVREIDARPREHGIEGFPASLNARRTGLDLVVDVRLRWLWWRV